MLHSLKELLKKFPYFLNHQKGSNFYKTEEVFNKWFKQVYDNLNHTYYSNHLSKPVQLWIEQDNPENYTVHVEINTKYLKKIKLTRLTPIDDETLEYEYTLNDLLENEQENITLINYEKIDEYNNHNIKYNNTLTDENTPIYTNQEEYKQELNTEYEQDKNNTLIHFTYTPKTPQMNKSICMDKYILYVETWLEEDFVKGYPENDTFVNESLFTCTCTGYTGFWDSQINPFFKYVDEYHENTGEIIDDDGNVKVVDQTLINIDKTVFNHDKGLDKIGLFLDVPRLTYCSVEESNLGNCEPAYFSGLTEPDHHYLGRLLGYTIGKRLLDDGSFWGYNINSSALPCLEVWKLFNIYADISNRESRLCKMINGHKHFLFDGNDNPVFDSLGRHVRNPDFSLMKWEHEDLMCTGEEEDIFLFATVNNHTPVLGSNLLFNVKLLNIYAEFIEKVDGVIVPYISTDDKNFKCYNYSPVYVLEDLVFLKSGENWRVGTDIFEDNFKLYFKFKYFENITLALEELDKTNGVLIEPSNDDEEKTIIVSDSIGIRLYGCDDGDYYVHYTQGDDNNIGDADHPFKTIQKALDMVQNNGLIILRGKNHHTDEVLKVTSTCTVMGCNNETHIYFYTPTLKLIEIMQGVSLTLVNVDCHRKCCVYSFRNDTILNHNITDTPVNISFSRNFCKWGTAITLQESEINTTTLDEVIIHGEFSSEKPNDTFDDKIVNISVDDETVATNVLLDDKGLFEYNFGLLKVGEHSIRVWCDETPTHCGTETIISCIIVKVTPVLKVATNFKGNLLGNDINIPVQVFVEHSIPSVANSLQLKLSEEDTVLKEKQLTLSTNEIIKLTLTYTPETLGEHILKLELLENDYYNPVSYDITCLIEKITPKIIASDFNYPIFDNKIVPVAIDFGETVPNLEARNGELILYDENNKILDKTSYIVNSKGYCEVVDLHYWKDKFGKYSLKIESNGTSYILQTSKNITATVIKNTLTINCDDVIYTGKNIPAEIPVIITSKMINVPEDARNITVEFMDKNNNIISTKNLTLTSEGYAETLFEYTSDTEGTYDFMINLKATDYYNNVTKPVTVEVSTLLYKVISNSFSKVLDYYLVDTLPQDTSKFDDKTVLVTLDDTGENYIHNMDSKDTKPTNLGKDDIIILSDYPEGNVHIHDVIGAPVLTIKTDKTSYYVGETVTFNGVLECNNQVMRNVEIVLHDTVVATTDNKGEFTCTDKIDTVNDTSFNFIANVDDELYEPTETTVKVSTGKYDVLFTAKVNATSGYVGDTFIYTGTLTSNGTPLSNVQIKDSEGTLLATTDKNGDWKYENTPMKMGRYTITFTPTIDTSKYGEVSSQTITVLVQNKNDYMITLENHNSDYTRNIYIGQEVTIDGYLHASTPIYTSIVDENGNELVVLDKGDNDFKYTFPVKNEVCTVTYTFTLKPDASYTSNTIRVTVNYVKIDTVLTVEASPLNPMIGETVTYKGTFKSIFGDPLGQISITPEIGQFAITESDGSWSYTQSYDNIGKKNWVFKIMENCVAWDKIRDKYNVPPSVPLSITVREKETPSLTITPNATRVYSNSGNVTYTGLLKDYQGNPISNATISVADNGNVKTDKDGKFTITKNYNVKGYYSITCSWDGDSIHKNITVKSPTIEVTNVIITGIEIDGKSGDTAELGDTIFITGATMYKSETLALTSQAGQVLERYTAKDVIRQRDVFLIKHVVNEYDIANNVEGVFLRSNRDPPSNTWKCIIE